MNKMSKKQLLRHITEVSFMLDDITLYLDTHPDCQSALDEYCKYKNMRMNAIHEYTEEFGPLTKYNMDTNNNWYWINSPWPWERECGC